MAVIVFLRNTFVVGVYGAWLCLVLLFLSYRVNSDPTQDKQALLDFLSKTPHSRRLQWNASDKSACNWVGVGCDANRSSVFSLRLPGVGLVGPIPANTIGRLTQLRVLSLRSNRLSGQIPSDFSNLKLLRSLYLQNNIFSGDFPPSLTELTRMIRLDLSNNNFTGSIPFSINNLTHLSGLFLQNNKFTSEIPSISESNLVNFNVSNNNLNGSIPKTLSKFPANSFAGNTDLCGEPLPPCNPSPPPPPPPQNPFPKKSKKLLTAAIIGISVGSAVFLLLLLLILILCLRPRPAARPHKQPQAAETWSSKEEGTGVSGEGERNELVFFDSGIYGFGLEDLLRASAEVLGKGSFGTSYKAVLEEGTTVVVKRLREVVVNKKEFEMQMQVLGKIKGGENENRHHHHVVPLRAYYYSKDEKLLVYDFMPGGTLSALLHGSRGSGRTPLDWNNRQRIALTAARGLAHLHMSGNVVHGNIKSSNILLHHHHHNYNAYVADFGLNSLFGLSTAPNKVVGYHAPEVIETHKATFKSDVYSFGVLLLELLTGRSPNQAEGIDLPRWVQSVVQEEWTAEVFDAELMGSHNVEEEMVQLLQIGLACVSTVSNQRPRMADVVCMIEEIIKGDTDDGLRQSSIELL